jgi:hypothetical protein
MQPSPWLKKMGKHVYNHPAFWAKCSAFETRIVQDDLNPITAPIYISGLARSGSTLLLEILNHHPDTRSLQYDDFPFMYVPWLWSHFSKQSIASKCLERAHQDGMMVSSKSPEAMEEMLWSHAFPTCHDLDTNHLLDESTGNPAFEARYRSTLQKLLFAYDKSRYLAKANYHVARIPYLLKHFPDARFIIPIRHPLCHIASLIKQHHLFTKMQQDDPYTLEHLRQVGHYEFGLDRRPINIGHTQDSQAIEQAWSEGNQVAGYALQWRHIYEHVYTLMQNPRYQASILLLPFEQLCTHPDTTLGSLFEHARLDAIPSLLHGMKETIAAPTYYSPSFSEKELETIYNITQVVAEKMGYNQTALIDR